MFWEDESYIFIVETRMRIELASLMECLLRVRSWVFFGGSWRALERLYIFEEVFCFGTEGTDYFEELFF